MLQVDFPLRCQLYFVEHVGHQPILCFFCIFGLGLQFAYLFFDYCTVSALHHLGSIEFLKDLCSLTHAERTGWEENGFRTCFSRFPGERRLRRLNLPEVPLIHHEKTKTFLGGGFKICLIFTPSLGKMNPF